MAYISLILILSFLVTLSQAKYIVQDTNAIRKLKTPLPKGCGQRGEIDRPNTLRLVQADTTDIDMYTFCLNACFDISPTACQSFSFYDNAEIALCYLYRKKPNEMGFTKSTSPQSPKFYTKDCFLTTSSTEYEVFLTEQYTTYDDDSFHVLMPFPLQFYSGAYYHTYISVNGFISFGGGDTTFGLDPPGPAYQPKPIPYYNGPPASHLPNNTLCGFWDDLVIQSLENRDIGAPDQYISWRLRGISPNRVITVHWKGQTTRLLKGYIDMEMEFYERNPQITVRYLNVDATSGSNASIGMQSLQWGKSYGYSYKQAVIDLGGPPILFDTDQNIIYQLD